MSTAELHRSTGDLRPRRPKSGLGKCYVMRTSWWTAPARLTGIWGTDEARPRRRVNRGGPVIFDEQFIGPQHGTTPASTTSVIPKVQRSSRTWQWRSIGGAGARPPQWPNLPCGDEITTASIGRLVRQGDHGPLYSPHEVRRSRQLAIEFGNHAGSVEIIPDLRERRKRGKGWQCGTTKQTSESSAHFWVRPVDPTERCPTHACNWDRPSGPRG
jgi:hypothetical protein